MQGQARTGKGRNLRRSGASMGLGAGRGREQGEREARRWPGMRCKRGPAKGPGSLSLTRLPALPPSIGMLLLCLALAFLTLFGDSPPFRISHVMCEVSEICCHFLFIPYVACCLLHIASRMPPGPSAHVRCPCWPRTCHRAMPTRSNQPGATPEDMGANNFKTTTPVMCHLIPSFSGFYMERDRLPQSQASQFALHTRALDL